MNANQEKKSRSIKKTLLKNMMGLVVIVSIVCSVSAEVMFYYNSIDSMTNRISESATSYSQVVQNAIEIYKCRAVAAAQNTEITDATLPIETRKKKMAALAQEYGFADIVVANSTGKTTNDTSIGDQEYFSNTMAAQAGVALISSTVVKETDKSPVLVLSTRASEYSGLVICTLSCDTFSKMIDGISIGKSGYGFIVDHTGKIIADKNRSNVTNFVNYIDKAKKDNTYTGIASVIKNMIASKTGTQKISFNGTNQCIGYKPIKDTDGWSIAVSANETELMSGFNTSVGIAAILTVLLALLSWLIANKIAKPIVNPIIAMTKRIEKLAQGDLKAEVPKVKNKNEIGVMANSLSKTISTLNSYISEISTVTDNLASGNFTIETYQNYQGDFVAIKESLNNTIHNLNAMFSEINYISEQVATGSSQVASVSQTLTQGATEQAGAIEELSASIADVASDVQSTASHVATANKLSVEESAEVERGNRHMQQLIYAMTSISETSSQIGKIIKTIDDIAFQTNILALNAAVEAARAGQAGKGFAVVADEVRNLANKSAQAAKNTAELIDNSLKAVDHGTNIANEAGESLSHIVMTVEKVANLVSEISTASNNQAAAISQITLGINQISAVVQTNSATSEESAATSERLSNQAMRLSDTLAAIKLKNITNSVSETLE